MASTTTLTNADLLKQFMQQNQGKDLVSTNQSGVKTDAPDVGSGLYNAEATRREASNDDDLNPNNDLSQALTSQVFTQYSADDQSKMLLPALQRLDNTQLGGDGMTERQRAINEQNQRLYGGSADSVLGKALAKAVADPMAPQAKALVTPTKPSTSLPGVTYGPNGTSGYDGSAGTKGLQDYLASLGHSPEVVASVGQGSGTTQPAGNAQPGPGQNGQPGQSNVQDLLNEFLESDPTLVLNHALNGLRQRGTSQVFVTWFIQNFDRFWGEYQGMVAEQALNGEIPDVSFVDYVLGLNLAQDFHGDASPTRSGTPSTRFAEFLSQGAA